MPLALFDLDHTLVNADTPSLWIEFLINKGVIRKSDVEQKMIDFSNNYSAGTLDFPTYMRFELSTIKNRPMETLLNWRREFQHSCLRKHIVPKARELLQQHRNQGDTIVMITATNRFVAQASADEFQIDHLIATDPERTDGKFSGDFQGTECFQAGKIKKLKEWMSHSGHQLSGSWFYSDSRNDLPLLETVCNPVVVNADPELARIAGERGWPALVLRQP